MIASSLDSTMEASRCAISSLRLRSVMSTNMFTAPTILPVASRSADGNAMNGMRVPSGRSTTASCPAIARPSCNTTAIGHSSCGSGVPSGQYMRHEPHHRSMFSVGRRPHRACDFCL
jgi:hypothetical protein